MSAAVSSPPRARREEWTMPCEQCDLVMKGGITSGVVYPGAIQEIARRFRFRNVGGASAGAIAAVVTAACEYRRQRGVVDAFDRLDVVMNEITRPNFVRRLFQPTPAAAPAFELALAFVTSPRSGGAKVATALLGALRRGRIFTAVAAHLVALWLAFLVFASWALARDGFSWVDVVAIALIGVVGIPSLLGLLLAVAVVALADFAAAANRALELNDLGMCSGQTQPDYPAHSALTDWLHTTIQSCAGLRDDEPPLTFAMLTGSDRENPDIDLRLVTTDLSHSRPVNLPLATPDELGENEMPYLFDRREFGRLFPACVVKHMTRVAKPAGEPGRELYELPAGELPVVVAARLSLSFPMLLSTVPLWKRHPEVGLVRHTMSDGGISSNFPIHFFDSLFPGRPTFGLDLQPSRGRGQPTVVMSDDPRLPLFTSVRGLAGFWAQLLNAARNWRDNMQAELPGYRDRICQIRLTKQEGGLNLNMPPEVVAALVERGATAGKLIRTGECFDWNRHRFVRYRTFMQMMQRSLGRTRVGKDCVWSGEGWRAKGFLDRPFREVLSECVLADYPSRPPDEQAWCHRAVAATDKLLALAARWDSDGDAEFDDDGAPHPTPTIRITPSV